MSAASETKIFGIRLGVDPKWVVVGLIAIALVFLYFNTRTTDTGTGAAATGAGFHTLPAPPENVVERNARSRRRPRTAVSSDRGVLRIRPVDATHGDIDPTLRLDLLRRLQTVPEAKITRSLFELQAAPSPTLEKIKQLNTQVIPAPIIPTAPVEPPKPLPPQVNVPLKFYGFVKPAGRSSVNRGLFLEADNVIVANEGDLVDHRYLIVELSPTSARVSDTELKQEQTLPLTPASLPQ